MNDILATAKTLAAQGYSVIPIRIDGSKAPPFKWNEYQKRLPRNDELVSWFSGDHPYDLGVVQGAVSGNAELTEIEGRAVDKLDTLAELAEASGLGELWQRINSGWVERSPSGGLHWHYRLDGTLPGNTVLARGGVCECPEGEKTKDGKIKPHHHVFAETRGEGGYVVVAPSCHHHWKKETELTGLVWERIVGGPETAPTLTMDEREALHAILSTLDETPPPPEPKPRTSSSTNDPGGLRPGDDFEARTDWADILKDWKLVYEHAGTRYWCRPGKVDGVSATTGHAGDRDRLYVFSTSTELPAQVPITKMGAYAYLHHGGDMSAAAKDLAQQGFGERTQSIVLDLSGLDGGGVDPKVHSPRRPPQTIRRQPWQRRQ